jgi:hypothetical protein
MLVMVTARLWQNGPDLFISIHLLSTRGSFVSVGLSTRTTGYYRTDTLEGIAKSV